MKTSVAICTFNSARFLPFQLASIASQSVLPDEVVVCDDGSMDETLTILEQWAEEVPFPVRIQNNAQNLGYTQNFGQAVSLCRGDVIFLADHDDVWLPSRIQRTLEAFEANPELGLVTSDAQIIDAEGNDQGMNLLEFVTRMHLHEFWRFFFPTDQKMTLWTGCTMAVRREFLAPSLPIPAGIACHDVWFYLTFALSSKLAFLPEPLIQYRLHGQNNSTAPTAAFLRENPSRWHYFNAFIETLQSTHPTLIDALETFTLSLPPTPRTERFLRDLRRHKRHFLARMEAPRRPVFILRELLNGGYFTHPEPLRSVLYDLKSCFSGVKKTQDPLNH